MIGAAKHSLLCTVATARVVVTSSCVAKVGEVSNVAQVAQICKGEMAECMVMRYRGMTNASKTH